MVMTNNILKFTAMAKYKKNLKRKRDSYDDLDTHDNTHLSTQYIPYVMHIGKNDIRKSQRSCILPSISHHHSHSHILLAVVNIIVFKKQTWSLTLHKNITSQIKFTYKCSIKLDYPGNKRKLKSLLNLLRNILYNIFTCSIFGGW